MIKVSNTRARRFSLGAEELIELGQILPQVRASVPPPAEPPSAQRAITVSPVEGKLMIQVVENIVSFAKDYPIEFTSYCPTDRWQSALTQVGNWVHEIETQIQAGKTTIQVPADAVFHMVDLEKCVSAARDARLTASRWAFSISAGAGILSTIFGIGFLSIPAWIVGLAILYGRPLYARYQATPEEPYAPVLAGRGRHFNRVCGLSGQCQLIAAKLMEEEKSNPNRRKVLERVIVSANVPIERHYWGYVRPRPGPEQGTAYLSKGRFRVRVEGWAADEVVPQNGWEFCDPEDCDGQIVLAVWSPGRDSSATGWGEVSQDSGHEDTYWVEYVGPLTGGETRRAGPFGCTVDPVAHAMEDGGFERAGVDGDYVIFDSAGQPVVEEAEVAV